MMDLPLVAVALIAMLTVGIRAKAQQDESISRDLDLRLSTTTMALCVGSSLPMELEITNLSNQEKKIDKVDLWSSFGYGFSRADGSGRGGGTGSSCSHCRGNYIALKPAGSYQSSYSYSLDNDFFHEPGGYTIKMNFGQLSTNELSFELYDCNSK